MKNIIDIKRKNHVNVVCLNVNYRIVNKSESTPCKALSISDFKIIDIVHSFIINLTYQTYRIFTFIPTLRTRVINKFTLVFNLTNGKLSKKATSRGFLRFNNFQKFSIYGGC